MEMNSNTTTMYCKKQPTEEDFEVKQTFSLVAFEIEQIDEWKKEHDKTCPYANKFIPPVGDRFTFCFSPSYIGNFIKVKCFCGHECNIDSNW
jgi:hypothetical protein